jgi:aspartyl-tRNA(Asn)/glutamyl-tRNA(Gln) amidotransferase subunit C
VNSGLALRELSSVQSPSPPVFQSPHLKNMLDREQVHKVALLARLELAPEEEEQYAKQMSSILDYFEQLSELDTEGIEPTTRAIDMSNITRHDQLSPYQNLEGIYDAAPDRETDFFKVPKIMA